MSKNDDKYSSRAWTTSGIDEALLRQLDDLKPSELWSVLLALIERRAAARTAASLTRQWHEDRFVEPAYIDQRTALELDRHLFAVAEGFHAIELSPLAPLAVCSAIAPTSQNRVVSTLRGTEVVSDPSNVLALECARRLRADPGAIVKLATSHRCVRAQQFPKLPGFAAHFRMFCMTSAGHETKDQSLTVDALIEHIQTHLRALDRLEQHGYSFPNRALTLLSSEARRPLAQRIAAGVGGIDIKHESLAKPYYDGLRFMISVGTPTGDIPLIDGGAFDWLKKLGSNHKLVFVASALGSQLVAYSYRHE
jgi:hypothetical protein